MTKRPVPDYDGREEPTSFSDVALWVPRLVVSPLYLTSEFLLRTPLGLGVTAAEEKELPDLVLDLFTWEGRGAGVFPTFLVDFGFRPSVGVYFFWNNLGVEGNRLRVQAATWGPSWLQLQVLDRLELDHAWALSLDLLGDRRPDWVFAGLGPRSEQEHVARFGQTRLQGALRLSASLWRSSRWQVWSGIRHARYGNDACCNDPSILAQVERGLFDVPPRFREGYTAYHQGFSLTIDSRRERPAPGDGIRTELWAMMALDVRTPAELRWVKYGADLDAYIDTAGTNRVLSLQLHTALADALGPQPVPFTELPSLGGNMPLRGFLQNRLLGRSAIAATAEYRWPVWMWLDGSVQFELGNVFGAHLRDFDPRLLRASLGVGLRTSGDRQRSVDLLIAVGTEPLQEGFDVTSFRFVLGTPYGL